MRRRVFDSAVVVFVVALLASISLHLPVYKVLGTLAEFFEEKHAAGATHRAPVSIEFEVSDSDSAETLPAPPKPDAVPQETTPPRDEPEAPPAKPPEEEKPQLVPAEPTPPPEAQPVNPLERQAIQQKSQNQQAPTDPKFIADENNRVEEETVARLRNYVEDSADPSAGAPQSESAAPEDGNANEDEIADMREQEGSEERTVTEEEAQADRPETSPNPPATSSKPQQARSAAESGAPERESASTPSSDPATEEIVVHDGHGTFVIRRPKRARAEDGSGDRARRGRQGRAARGRNAPNLKLSWSQFATVMGEDRLREQREAYVRERRSKRRGSTHQQRWKEFRAALENFTPTVRPGNQTALNAAASPFATYLATVHRRIHRQFSDRFVAGLPTYGGSPFSDPSLVTTLEIVFNEDGSLHKVGIAKASGFLPFDYGAYNAVMSGQPYPSPPSSILSGDGRVYMHWGFYRNERRCGTFNAKPYILPNPGGGSKPPRDGFRDGPVRNGARSDTRKTFRGAPIASRRH